MFVDQFIEWAHDQLGYSDLAQEYFLGRGVSKDQWSRHRLGFIGSEYDVDPTSDPSHSAVCSDWEKKYSWCDSCHYRNWSSIWEAPEEGPKKIQHVGRRIIGGVVFPLTTYSGKNVGFQIRSIEKKEYDTFAIRRRPEGHFFGIGPNVETIWSSREVVLVEGPFDQLIMERLVRPDVLALTTANVSISQARFLKRFVRRVYLCQDLDKAGRKSVRNFIDQYSNDFDIVSVKYPRIHENAKDVGDLWKKVGDTQFKKCFKEIAA